MADITKPPKKTNNVSMSEIKPAWIKLKGVIQNRHAPIKLADKVPPINPSTVDPRQNIRQCPPLSFFRFGNIVVHIVQVIPSHWLNDGVSDYNRLQYIQIVLY